MRRGPVLIFKALSLRLFLGKKEWYEKVMKPKHTGLALFVLLSLPFASGGFAASPAPEPKQTQSHSEVGKKAGAQAGQKGGIYVVGRGFKTAGHEMKEGFKTAGRGIEKGGKAAGRGFKKAGHEIKGFFTGEEK